MESSLVAAWRDLSLLQQGLVGTLGLALAWWLLGVGLRSILRVALIGLLAVAVMAMIQLWGRPP